MCSDALEAPMISAISVELAREREQQLRQTARMGRLAGRLRFRRAEVVASVETDVTIRVASPADEEAVSRLAELDSRPAPAGYVLVAEVGGELRAAVPVSGGEPVADPFHSTAALTSLLALRARQLRAGGLEPSPQLRRGGLVAVPNRQ
jgi:hypothetical protein